MNHRVFGPNNIKYLLEEHLDKESISNQKIKEYLYDLDENYIKAASACQADLKNKLIDNGISTSKVIINDWRIAIATEGFRVRVLNQIDIEGHIKRSEPYCYPYYDESGKIIGMGYHFHTGKIYGKKDTAFKLNIVSETKPKLTSYLMLLIIYIFIITEIFIFSKNITYGIISLLLPTIFWFITKIFK